MIGVDTELLEAFPGYSSYGNGSAERVRFVLMKLSAKEDRERQIKNNPDKDWSICDDLIETYNKFIICVVKTFGSLPKPKDWRSFYNNDLPLLTTIDDEVQAVAVHRSNNQNRDATPGQRQWQRQWRFLKRPKAEIGNQVVSNNLILAVSTNPFSLVPVTFFATAR